MKIPRNFAMRYDFPEDSSNERPKLDRSVGFIDSCDGNRLVPIAPFSLDATLADTSFDRELRPDHWTIYRVALRPSSFLLRGHHGWSFRNVDVGDLEAP
jgi:hypothetical protein